ncbi:zinc finger protein 160-like [Sitodiplosis mosellana]|uniref:zinc finger protein 160-like n=1 Tax=Sitodiplosis mosellana TaxID=263140 RepID=UPI0024451981|nr:zinc finger protein 160-like [Sitodiplosis mosellana]
MSGTITVHQCLFCPQTFGSAAAKDDHTLEHFAQETCADCNQNLIRIGANLYTLHDTVTCIKRVVKKDHCLSTSATTDSLVANENPLDFDSVNCGGGFAAVAISSKSICAQQLEIKREPADVGYSQQLDDPFHSNKIEPNPNCTKFSFEYCRKVLLSEPTLDIHVRNCKWKEKLESERSYKVDDMVEKRLMPSSSDVQQQGKQQIAHQENLFVIEKGLEADYSLIEESNVKREPEIDIDMPERYEQDEFDDSDESMDLSDFQEIKKAIRTQMENEKMVNERQCNVCHKIMSSAESLRNHMKWNHNSNFKKPDQRAYIKCDVCDRILYNKGNLQRHKISVHGASHSHASSSAIQLPENSEQEKIEDFGERMHLNGNQKLETEVQSQKKNLTNLMVGENQCSICHKIMSSDDSLRNHMKWNHNRDPNFKKRDQKTYAKCDDCDRTFFHKGNLQRHRQSVHGKKHIHDMLSMEKVVKSETLCHFCDTVFPTKDDLLSHQNECPMKDEHRQKMQRQKLTQQNQDDFHRIFECFMCKRRVKTKQNLTRHMQQLHSNEPQEKIQCETCGLFVFQRSMRKHYNYVHLKIGGCVCDVCGKKFSVAKILRFHKIRKHGATPDTIFCNFCAKICSTEDELLNHQGECPIKRRYDQKMLGKPLPKNKAYFHRTYECYVCKEIFLQKSNIDSHMKWKHVHVRERNEQLMCSVCGVYLKTVQGFKYHMAIHTGEKRFKCLHEGCDKSFRATSNLNNHMKTHMAEKTVQCTIDGCNQTFPYSSALIRHKFKVHGIPFPEQFPCSICNKIFQKKYMMKLHMKIHTRKTHSKKQTKKRLKKQRKNVG